jgi:hypothetical protein
MDEGDISTRKKPYLVSLYAAAWPQAQDSTSGGSKVASTGYQQFAYTYLPCMSFLPKLELFCQEDVGSLLAARELCSEDHHTK